MSVNRPIKIYELILGLASIAGVVLTQFLYLRDSVLRHDVEMRYLKEAQQKTDQQFDKIEQNTGNILRELTTIKVEMKDKANRPETTSNK